MEFVYFWQRDVRNLYIGQRKAPRMPGCMSFLLSSKRKDSLSNKENTSLRVFAGLRVGTHTQSQWHTQGVQFYEIY